MKQVREAAGPDERGRRTVQEARLKPGPPEDLRWPHLGQLAEVPQRVRAPTVPVRGRLLEKPSGRIDTSASAREGPSRGRGSGTFLQAERVAFPGGDVEVQPA